MYCRNCGKEIDNGAYICPFCGVRTVAQQTNTAPGATNGMAIAGLICAFFMPLLGFIFGCVGLSKSKSMNGEGKGMSIAAIAISLIWIIGIIIIAVSVIGMAAAMSSTAAAGVLL